jgi:non-homologous end joining protein Ku
MPAPAPSRSSGSFSISFGLLNIPVSLYTGTEEVRVKRTQWTKDGRKTGNQTCVKNDDGSYGEPVERHELVKRYDTGEGLVEISDDEIDALSTTIPGVADILGVLPQAHLHDGTYLANGSVWQVRASKLGSGRAAKPNPGGQKAFSLLLAALRAERSFALIRFGKGGVVQHAALLHTGELIGLYTDAEVREQTFLPEVPLADDEISAARALLKTAKSRTPIALENDLVGRVQEYALEKIAGEDRPKIVAEAPTQGVDIMSLLRASVEAAKAERVSA